MFRCLVVGLGKIGMGYDYTFSLDSNHKILTHCSGVVSQLKLELVGAVDRAAELREKFEKKYRKPAWESLDFFCKEQSRLIDIVVIATPTGTHLKLFKEILSSLSPKLVIIEKPFGLSIDESNCIRDMAQQNGVKLLVNYMRRFEPGVNSLKNMIDSGRLGNIYKGTICYSKGVENNGSHFIDFLHHLFGPSLGVKVFKSSPSTFLGDYDADFCLEFSGKEFYFFATNSNNFTAHDVHLYGDKGAISYLEDGRKIFIREVQIDPDFSNNNNLGREVMVPSDYLRFMKYFYEHVVSILEKNVSTNGHISEVIKTKEILDLIKIQIREKNE